MSITFNFLPAGSGDAILVSADHKNILIDGGDNRTYYRVIEDKLQKIKEKQQYLDLVVLTHVHDDHINGLLELLEDEQMRLLVKEIWFNSFNQFTVEPTESSYKTSLKQGITFNEFVDRIKRENDSLKFEKHISIEKYDSRVSAWSFLTIILMACLNYWKMSK
jgi:metal-dependent hydrolase (beta-lactamase superfamily II)